MGNIYPDISHYDTVKSWPKMAKETSFLIFKGTQRTNFVDPKMKSYILSCEKYKTPYWIYTFLEKGNEEAQAKFLVETCKDQVGEHFVGYVLDAEKNNAAGDILSALEVILAAKKKAIVYTMYSQYRPALAACISRIAQTKDVAWWEARYGTNTGEYDPLFKPHSGVDLHQYTDRGAVEYISGTVDLNRLTGTIPEVWFTDPNYFIRSSSAVKVPEKYSGEIPKFPARGYYKRNDGITTYLGFIGEIRKVQRIVKFVTGESLVVDGKYGPKTKTAVEKAQEVLNVKVDGLFGPKTLEAALKMTK